MDLFTITVAVVSGAAVGAFATRWRYDTLYRAATMKIIALNAQNDTMACCLGSLRRNAFITNAKGHRVRYTNATAEERAKAEGEV